MLLAGAGAAASAAIPKIAIAAGKKLGGLSEVDRSTWEPLVGTVLETRNRGFARVPLLLVKISDPTSSYRLPESVTARNFVLVFRGPVGQPLMESTHTLFVPGVGKIDIWFSGSRLTDEGWEYVAVFTNSRQKPRPAKKPNASRGRRAQARERSRKSEKLARRRRREQREEEREQERERRRERKRARELEKSS